MRTLTRVFFAVFCMMVLVGNSTSLFAQDDESPISFGLTLENRYVWRGYQYNGDGPSLQPSFAFSMGGFEIGAWGGYSFASGASSETDVYLSYSFAKMLTITVTDFYYHGGDGLVNQYFDFETGHTVEAALGIAPEGFPLSFLAAVNVYGDKYTDGEDEKEAYSAYLEATYSTEVKGVDFSAFAGFAISKEESGWYPGSNNKGATGFVNVGVGAEKKIKITDSFSLPVHGKVIFNPAQENYYIVFGMSF